jgi:hypothetical protein
MDLQRCHHCRAETIHHRDKIGQIVHLLAVACFTILMLPLILLHALTKSQAGKQTCPGCGAKRLF